MLLKDIPTAVGWGLALCAALVGSISIINTIIHFLELGLDEFLQTIVDYYRSIMFPLYTLIEHLPIRIPKVCADLLVLYSIGVAANIRLVFGISHVEEANNFPTNLRMWRLHLVFPYNPLIIVRALHLRRHIRIRWKFGGLPNDHLHARDTHSLRVLNQVILSVGLIPVAVTLFFSYNVFSIT